MVIYLVGAVWKNVNIYHEIQSSPEMLPFLYFFKLNLYSLTVSFGIVKNDLLNSILYNFGVNANWF